MPGVSLTNARRFGPRPYPKNDLSGAVQTASSRLLRRHNEVYSSKNASFNKKIGSATRRDGYEQVGRTIQIGNDGLGAHIYKYGANNKVVVGINNASNTNATLQIMDTGDYWTPILANATPNTRFHIIDFLEEMYVAGYSRDYNAYLPLTNIDPTFVPSTSKNVYGAPASRFVAEYQGSLYAINCSVNGVQYKDRFYRSSVGLGAITFVQNDQQGLLQQLQVDTVQFLKAGMTIDVYTGGTNSQIVSALTIVSVNKKSNQITFAPTQLAVKDNDEIWLTGRKGKLSVFWNTDYPTPETADWGRIPSGYEENPEITAWGKNNNRLLLFTKNTLWKWDGANLVNVSDSVGCIASETVRNIAGWTLFLHYSGVWGYNDSTGQIKLLSRGIDNYIKAMNLANAHKFSAVANGRVYKLSIGEISELESSTTSTSTSSTSTSSTSSSTSSTSTSSTSTSSTSSSTSTTTNTSTSTSTSSTSTSSTSTSISTSSTSTSMSTSSTSTSTIASTKKVIRMIYDFDMNVWWPEEHKREFRFQLMHTMNGYTKPYFLDETGRFWRDEVGGLDGIDTIPFEVELGRDNYGTGLRKTYIGAIVETERARGAQVLMSLDNGNWLDVGQITTDVQEILFGPKVTGRDVNFRFVHNDAGDAPSLDGITPYYLLEETTVG